MGKYYCGLPTSGVDPGEVTAATHGSFSFSFS